MPPIARVTGTTELRRLGVELSALGDAGKVIRADVRAVITVQTERIKKAAQQAARDIPSKGGKPYVKKGEDPPPPLRESLAKSVRAKVLFSARSDVCEVRGVPNKMRNGAYNLGAFLEGKAAGTHPLFGKPPRYTIEPHPWFHLAADHLAEEAALQISAAVLAALETVERIK